MSTNRAAKAFEMNEMNIRSSDFSKLWHKLAEYSDTNWYHAMADIDLARKLYGDDLGRKVIETIMTGMSWEGAVQDVKWQASRDAEQEEARMDLTDDWRAEAGDY